MRFVLVLVLVGLLVTVAQAMPPDNGVYPTSKGKWEDCCHDRDCKATPVQILWMRQGKVGVQTGRGSFVTNKTQIHQITQPGAEEHLCTLHGLPPRRDDSNVVCVFYAVGYQ